MYSRMRYQDPEGDYGRQNVNVKSFKKIVEKVLSLNSVSHYQGILKALRITCRPMWTCQLKHSTIARLSRFFQEYRNASIAWGRC